MKIKQSNASIKTASLAPVFLVITLISIVIRAVQMRYFIEIETGFFKGGTVLNIAFYLLLAISFAVFCAVSFISKDSKRVDIASIYSKKLSVFTVVFAISLFVDSFAQFSNSLDIYDKLEYREGMMFRAMMSSGALPLFLQSICAFLAAVYFIMAAKSFSKGNRKIRNYKFLAIAPVFWAGFKLITRFVKQISFVQISDLLLELIMVAFMLIFFMSFAQLASGVYCDDVRWRISAFGFSSALIAIGLNVSRGIMLFVRNGVFLQSEYPFSLTDLIYGVFVAALCIILVMKKHDKLPEI